MRAARPSVMYQSATVHFHHLAKCLHFNIPLHKKYMCSDTQRVILDGMHQVIQRNDTVGRKLLIYQKMFRIFMMVMHMDTHAHTHTHTQRMQIISGSHMA